MITRKLYEDFVSNWIKTLKGTPDAEAKQDLGYAFFIAGVATMSTGLGALMESGAGLAAQKLAASVREDCTAEIIKLQKKYQDDKGMGLGDFKL